MIQYAVLTLLIVFLVQTIAEAAWYPPYFRHGLVIYRWQRLPTSPVIADLSEATLEASFRGVFGPSQLFRQIGPGEFAFRHPTLEFRLLTYTPLMHGLLRVEPHFVQVEGRANWFTVAFVGWIFAFVWQVRESWPFLVFAALFLGAGLLAAQIARTAEPESKH